MLTRFFHVEEKALKKKKPELNKPFMLNSYAEAVDYWYIVILLRK
jgi:hypothetical protein